MIPILSHEAERQKVDIHPDVESDLAVWGDREALKEILFNLILNGIEATEADKDGLVSITGRRHLPDPSQRGPTEGSANWVEIAVTDTGPGIPQDVRPHIFEPFYTTKTSGTGLGLATVKRAVERVGGTVVVTSGVEHERGAVFLVRLPGGDE